jgi:hypothetical protein
MSVKWYTTKHEYFSLKIYNPFRVLNPERVKNTNIRNQQDRKMAHQPQINICEPCYCISVIMPLVLSRMLKITQWRESD